jgi:hypothetical protein
MRTLIVGLVLLCAIGAQAQVKDSLVIELKNGEIMKIPFNDFYSISFHAKAGVADHQEKQPTTLVYPNPASATATITFSLASAQLVRVEISDATGKTLRTLERHSDKGKQEIHWDGMLSDGSTAPVGTYLYRIIANGDTSSGKLTLRR